MGTLDKTKAIQLDKYILGGEKSWKMSVKSSKICFNQTMPTLSITNP
jgi:hypothetical protein